MNKKLLVVALAGLGAALALPATADFKITGKFYPAYQVSDGGEATDGKVGTATLQNNGNGNPDTTKVEAYNSNIRFAAKTDLGGGLTGWVQCETDLDFDDDRGQWCGRNSALGLKGGFGNVFLGKWDTPFKQLHFPTNMFGISSGSPLSNSNLLSRTPYSDRSSRASFHRRQDNMVQYWSPSFGGFQVKAMWGTEELDTRDPPKQEPERTSVSLVYEQGPLEVGVAWEEHQDICRLPSADDPGDPLDRCGGVQGLNGTTLDDGVTNTTDEGITLAVVYKLGKNTEIGFDFETLTYETDNGAATALKEYERDAWRVGVEHKIGKWQLGFNYGSADEGDCSLRGGGLCSTKDLGATQTSIGGMYKLTKKYGVYAWWTEIDNDDSASYSFLDDAPTGADPSAMAIGLYARF